MKIIDSCQLVDGARIIYDGVSGIHSIKKIYQGLDEYARENYLVVREIGLSDGRVYKTSPSIWFYTNDFKLVDELSVGSPVALDMALLDIILPKSILSGSMELNPLIEFKKLRLELLVYMLSEYRILKNFTKYVLTRRRIFDLTTELYKSSGIELS